MIWYKLIAKEHLKKDFSIQQNICNMYESRPGKQASFVNILSISTKFKRQIVY